MTDDEINRKVAEIEGWKQDFTKDGREVWTDTEGDLHIGTPPFTRDWSLCGLLLTKYRVNVFSNGHGTPFTASVDAKEGGDYCASALSLRSAICAAVIEANHPQS